MEPLKQEDKTAAAAARAAVKGDYKASKDSLHMKDIVKYLDKCYTDYIKYSQDLTLPKDVRLSYLDRATMCEITKEYIERQSQ